MRVTHSVRLHLKHERPYQVPAAAARAAGGVSIYVDGPSGIAYLGQRKHLGRHRYRRTALAIPCGESFVIDWPMRGACLRPGGPGMVALISWQD